MIELSITKITKFQSANDPHCASLKTFPVTRCITSLVSSYNGFPSENTRSTYQRI